MKDLSRRDRANVAGFIFALLAAALAIYLLAGFFSAPRELWRTLLHDRSAHYRYGLKMALALEHGHAGQFLDELEKGKTWPPLHGLLVALTQLFTGNDWRFAVLPSCAGWCAMLWGAWFVAQKIAAPTGLGFAAGAVAFIFAALSPAHRLFATDIMLESLGAALTMLTLAAYLRAAEQPTSRGRWRFVAIALTLLFFEKYNYWLIVALALAATKFSTLAAIIRETWRGVDWRAWMKTQPREPLNWLIAILLALVVWLFCHGPFAVEIFARRVSLYPPNNLVTAAYAALFARVALAIHRARWKPCGAARTMLWRWHFVPVAIAFLFPQRLSAFAAFLSLSNAGDAPLRGLRGAAIFYAHTFSTDYHASSILAGLAVLLALFAICRRRALSSGARAVMICAAMGMALTILHPNQKSRFLISWMPALWAMSGAGAALALRSLPRRSFFAAAGIAALACAGGRAWLARWPKIAEGNSFNLLDLSDTWLSALDGKRRIAFVATQPCRPFVEWTFLQRDQSSEQLEWPGWQEGKGDDEIHSGFEKWQRETTVDALVYLEILPDSPEFVPAFDQAAVRAHFCDWMQQQTLFKQKQTLAFSTAGCVATVWVKR